MTLGHPGVLEAIVFGAVAVSLIAVIGVGLGGANPAHRRSNDGDGGRRRRRSHARPAPSRRLAWYLPGTALQSAVTVHRSPGILRPGMAIVVLGVYAAIALAAASIRVAHRDA